MKELGAEWSGMPENKKASYFELASEGTRINPNLPK
jgi:hypothetical protein